MVKYIKANKDNPNGYTIGYRNDDYYGSHITDLYKIVEYEIEELGNLDIPDYLYEHYEFDYVDDETLSEQTVGFLKSEFPEYRYGLWLASKKSVSELYGGEFSEVREYKIPETAIIISDLGFDGFLVATKERLYPQEDNSV